MMVTIEGQPLGSIPDWPTPEDLADYVDWLASLEHDEPDWEDPS